MKANPFLASALLLGLLLGPSKMAALSLEIVLALPPQPGISNRILGSAAFHNLDRPDLEPTVIEITAPGLLQVDTSNGERWLARLTSQDYWADELSLEGKTNLSQRWVFHPVVRYRIERSRLAALPTEVFANFDGVRTPGSAEAPPAGRVRCIGGPQHSDCALPAVPLDLKIEPEGFAPVFFWNLQGKPGELRSLGPISLLAGASIAGRVVDGAGHPLVAELEAHPSTSRDPSSPDLETNRRLGLKVVKANSDQDGRFQIVGIPPGEFDIKASASGFVPTTLIRQIQLVGGEAQLIQDPLVFLHPERLRLQLIPERDPWNRPWIVELIADALEGIEEQKAPAKDDGAWISAPNPPGRYSLEILDHREQVWDRREIDLEKGEDVLPIEIPVLQIRGRANLAGDPAAGILYLQQHPSVQGLRFELDEDGKFEGFVAGEGRWLASLERSGGGGSAIVAVDVRKRPGKSYAEVEVVFPDTRIHGHVTDTAGKKIADAVISYFSVSTKAMGTVRSDAEGSFEILGVPPGPVNLNAKKEALQSPGIIISVEDSIAGPPLELVLHEQVEIEGLVVASGSPLAGARIVAWPDFGSTSLASLFSQTSSPDGGFLFEVPSFVPQLTVFAEARGIRRLLRHPVRSSERLIIEMDVQGGELAVDLTQLLADRGPEALVEVSLVHDGIQLPLIMWNLLRLQASPTPGLYRLGLFEAGNYSLCVGLKSPNGPAPACSSGFLAPSSVLQLTPAPAAGERKTPHQSNSAGDKPSPLEREE